MFEPMASLAGCPHFSPFPGGWRTSHQGCTVILPLFPEEEGPGLVGVWVPLMLLPAGLWCSHGAASADSVTDSCLRT